MRLPVASAVRKRCRSSASARFSLGRAGRLTDSEADLASVARSLSEDVSAPRGEHGSAASSAASRSGRPTSTDADRRPSVYPSRSSRPREREKERADPQAGGKVGAQLLQRTPRSVSISDAGAVMLHEARRVVQQRRSSGGGPCGRDRPIVRLPHRLRACGAHRGCHPRAAASRPADARR